DVAHLAVGGVLPFARAVGEVEAAEDEPLVLVLEVGQAAGGVVDEGVTLEEPGHLLVPDVPGAGGASAGHAVDGDEVGALAGLGEFGVHAVEVFLLDRDLGGDGVDMGIGHGVVPLPSGSAEGSSLVAAGGCPTTRARTTLMSPRLDFTFIQMSLSVETASADGRVVVVPPDV